MKKILISLFVIIILAGFRLVQPAHAAVLNQVTGASSTVTMTAGSTGITMIVWAKRATDAADFLGGFYGGTAFYIFEMDRGGAWVSNNVVCRVNGTATLSGARIKAGEWM